MVLRSRIPKCLLTCLKFNRKPLSFASSLRSGWTLMDCVWRTMSLYSSPCSSFNDATSCHPSKLSCRDQNILWRSTVISSRSRSSVSFNRSYFAFIFSGYEVQHDDSQTLTDYRVKKLRDFSKLDLIADFFAFYRDFNYGDHVISPHFGKVFLKSRWLKFLCSFVITLKSLRLSTKHPWNKPMCLEGPIIRERNHAYQVGKKRLRKFIKICTDTYDCIME